MQSGRIACLVVLLGTLATAAAEEDRYYAPTLSCLDTTENFPPPTEVHRTPVMVSPNKRFHAYARIDAKLGGKADQPCRTRAQLFISSSKSAFKAAFVEETSRQDDATVSVGPVAWSPNSRWLVLERFRAYFASDAGGIDFVLYDSRNQKTSTPDVLAAIAKSIGKNCELGYGSFKGFDTSNRMILRVADWQDGTGEQTHCIDEAAEWLFDPVTGKVQLAARGKPR